MKDEIALTHNFFSFIYNSNNIFCNILEKAINIIASPFSNHVILLILKKNEKKKLNLWIYLIEVDNKFNIWILKK